MPGSLCTRLSLVPEMNFAGGASFPPSPLTGEETERFSNLPKIAQPGSDLTRIQTLRIWTLPPTPAVIPWEKVDLGANRRTWASHTFHSTGHILCDKVTRHPGQCVLGWQRGLLMVGALKPTAVFLRHVWPPIGVKVLTAVPVSKAGDSRKL